MKFRIVFTAFLVAAMGLAAQAEEPLNLLFFGNSFTLRNNVGPNVGKLAVADGHVAPQILTDLQNGSDLDYHIGQVNSYPQNNVSNPMIAGDRWDYVVIQGYSTEATHLGDPADFRGDVVTLYNSIKNHSSGSGIGVKVVLCETWARPDLVPGSFATMDAMQLEIYTNYQAAADDIRLGNGIGSANVSLVGEAFKDAGYADWLYASDNYHADVAGSLLASMVHYRTIYGEDLSDMSYGDVSSWVGVSQSQWDSLVAVADAQPIPEPTTISLLVLGVLPLILHRSKSRQSVDVDMPKQKLLI